MLYTSLKIIILTSIFFTNSTCASFGKEPEKMVTFQGEEKYLMNLLIASHFNHNHPFSTTQIIRKEGTKFNHVGDIVDLQEQDYQNIYHLNYVYLNDHTQRPTRLSNDEIVRVSLLILGTKNRDACLKLQFKQRINQEIFKPYEQYFLKMNNDQI